MDNSNLPVSMQLPKKLVPANCDVDAFVELADIKSNIVDFVNSGKSIYIASNNTGNGKTSWSIKLMLKYFDEVWLGNGFKPRAVFIHVPTFLLKCKDFSNQDPEFLELKKKVLDVDLVVWDDIASTELSAYDFSQLIMYLDNRFSANKSNIFTGNIVSADGLERAVGMKLTSRILSSRTKVIVFKGGDKR